jgi:hypothetical protein
VKGGDEKEKCVSNEAVNYYDVNSFGDFINETAMVK